jgi:hypothetical protein
MDVKKANQTRKNILDMKDKAQTGFVMELNAIIDAVCQKNSKDIDIVGVRDKFNIIRRENPTMLLEMAGPHVWEYRVQIKDENIGFFLNNSFEKDIEKAQSQSAVAEITDFEDIPVIMNKIKSTWHRFMSAEQQIIIKRMKALIAHYATYVSATRELNKESLFG